MSSKATIFSLNGLEHWHEELVDPRDSIGVEFEQDSIADSDTTPGNGITVWVKADSQLGRLLSHPDVRAVLARVAGEQNDGEATRYAQLLP